MNTNGSLGRHRFGTGDQLRLPHNPAAERALLGAILLDGNALNNALRTALEQANCGDFFMNSHRAIFRRMVAMAEAGQVIDLVTLCDELDRPAELQKRLTDLLSSNGEMGPEPGMLRIVPRCPMNLFRHHLAHRASNCDRETTK